MAAVRVRYIVDDVDDVDAVQTFYCTELGFRVAMHPAPTFVMLARDDLQLVLSAPGPEGGGPDVGRRASAHAGRMEPVLAGNPGLGCTVAALRAHGVRFRNDVVTGVGGRQALVVGPSGNPV